VAALSAPHSPRNPGVTWGRVAASFPFPHDRPHPLKVHRERGRSFLLYNPAATLKVKVKIKVKIKIKVKVKIKVKTSQWHRRQQDARG
jgi:hypothetical protein